MRIVAVPSLEVSEEEVAVEGRTLAEGHEIGGVEFPRRIHVEGNDVVRDDVLP